MVAAMYLVSGVTGNVGREVARALRRAGADVRALVRNDTDAVPDGVERVVGNLDEPGSVRDALKGVRCVFYLPGYQDMPGLMAAARDAGAERVVQLSGRSAAGGHRTDAISTYMIASEHAAQEAGMDWTIVRPSAYYSNTYRWLDQLKAGDVVREPFADVAVAGIDPYDVGNVIATALVGDGHADATYELSGPEALLPADRLRILGSVLGRSLRLEPLPNDVARREMLETVPRQYVDAFFSFYADGMLDESPVLPTVYDVTGQQPRSFETWAREHASAF